MGPLEQQLTFGYLNSLNARCFNLDLAAVEPIAAPLRFVGDRR